MLPYIVLSLTIVLAYVMIFSESKNPIAIARMLRCLRQRDWRLLQFSLPCWLLNIILMLLASLLLPFSSEQYVELAGLSSEWFFDYFSSTLMFTVVLFVLRDMCIILWLNFFPNRKRADFAAVLYLALSYGLLPLILLAMNMDAARVLFLPMQEAGITGLIVAAAEAAIFFWLMQKRWQANFGALAVIGKSEAGVEIER